MPPPLGYIDATLAAAECTKRTWHPTTECKNSEEEEARRFQRLKSDLFKSHEYDVPIRQKEIMNRNQALSPLLRLPPELRLRIYKLVFGSQQLWFTHTDSKLHQGFPYQASSSTTRHKRGQWYHEWGEFIHCTPAYVNGIGRSRNLHKLSLGLLRVCRHIYTEAALLPYALNTFTFRDDLVRKMFEQIVRPGKKRVQKKAVGKYTIESYRRFCARHTIGQNKSTPIVLE